MKLHLFLLFAFLITGCTATDVQEPPLQAVTPETETPPEPLENLGEDIGNLDEDYLDAVLADLSALQ